jgi:hypothetical protein
MSKYSLKVGTSMCKVQENAVPQARVCTHKSLSHTSQLHCNEIQNRGGDIETENRCGCIAEHFRGSNTKFCAFAGRNLGKMMVATSLAALYSNFTFRLAEEVL